MMTNLDQLLEHARRLGRRWIAVVGAHNETALAAALEAERIGLAQTIFIGPVGSVGKLLKEMGAEEFPSPQVRDGSDEEACAQTAVQLVRSGEAEILLKGAVDTATLMRAVLDSSQGLRTGRLLSDVFIAEVHQANRTKLLMITDGGVTPHPDRQQKIEIIHNAVEVAHALGCECPKVALLSATEKVTPAVPSTLDAAIITQMNRRGQIPGCVVDGPLALDLAVSADSARVKGLDSPVAGQADILVAPDMEVANVLAKSTTYFAGFRLAHVIVGGRAPILIPSRSDTMEAKLFSIALGIIMSEPRRHGKGIEPDNA
jgi:phosphate butyryltransferase